ncbi:hypothetical protein AZH46_00230 [Corynebacterium striatum]|nr:hypothetical protein AZH46_00230 [Corynebacterium striatum]
MRCVALDDDSITSGKQARELNGGTGTLLKDGSFLEAMAALYSLHTGQPMDDDIVSWGQVVGLYSKAAEESGDKLTEDSKKGFGVLGKEARVTRRCENGSAFGRRRSSYQEDEA